MSLKRASGWSPVGRQPRSKRRSSSSSRRSRRDLLGRCSPQVPAAVQAENGSPAAVMSASVPARSVPFRWQPRRFGRLGSSRGAAARR